MRLGSSIVALAIATSLTSSCTETSEPARPESEVVESSQPDPAWTRNIDIAEAAAEFITPMLGGDPGLSVMDPFSGTLCRIGAPAISGTQHDPLELRVLGPYTRDVLAQTEDRTTKEPIVVAFTTTWNPGVRAYFKVTDLLLYKVNDIPRYTYVKRGPYYVRKVATPPSTPE